MTNNTITILKTNIKKYRLRLNLTQEKLSEISGISSDYLSEIERGKNPEFKKIGYNCGSFKNSALSIIER